jgi:ABC-2 type transport system permease protein
MIRLFGAEISRLLSRRFTVIASIAVLLALSAFQFPVNQEISPPSGEELASAQQAFEEERKEWVENHEEYEQECQESGEPPENCVWEEPTLDSYTSSAAFDEIASISLQVSIYLVALAALMVAGSFIGAEYSTGSIANWLTFIPRRGPVFASKLITVVTVSALASAVAAALMIGIAVGLARWYDVPVVKLAETIAMGGRGILVAVALAVLGFCIGLIGRHTAAAIGVLLGYLFVWFVRNLLLGFGFEGAARLAPWTPEANLSAIVSKGTTYDVPVRQLTPDGVSVDYVERTISFAHGLTYWGIVLAVVIVAAALIFRRRDVS